MIYSIAVEKPQDLLGTVVISKRGRDAGRPCVIIGWLPGDYALIADGRRRTAAKPKKKNMKHLIFTQYRIKSLGEMLLAGAQVTDRMIRQELAVIGERSGEGP